MKYDNAEKVRRKILAIRSVLAMRSVFKCEVCGRRATHWRNVGEDLNAAEEIWVGRCDQCLDAPTKSGNA